MKKELHKQVLEIFHLAVIQNTKITDYFTKVTPKKLLRIY